jgi:hypothetical protein
MKWHSAVVWLLSVHNHAAQLFAVPPHCVMLHAEAATIGGLAEDCFVLDTDMSVCLSLLQPSPCLDFSLGRKYILFVKDSKHCQV